MKKEMTPHGKYAFSPHGKYAFSLTYDDEITSNKLEEIAAEYLPHYGLYHRKGNHQDVFCTRCMSYYELYKHYPDVYPPRAVHLGTAKHGEKGECPLCREEITFLADGRGRRNVVEYRNFVKFKIINEDEITASCFRIKQSFLNPDSGEYFTLVDGAVFEHSVYEVARYYFGKGQGPKKFVKDAWYENFAWHPYWVERKRVNEPEFVHSMYRWADNSYTVLNYEELMSTSFGYLIEALETVTADTSVNHCYFKFILEMLGEYCKHPQIEYLIKAGFGDIVNSRMLGSMHGLRLNWRSNDLRKVLGMTSQEVKLLKGHNTEFIADYKAYKKVDRKSSPEEIIQMLKRCSKGGSAYKSFVKRLIEEHGETCRSIFKYIRKQSENVDYRQCSIPDEFGMLTSWKDYLAQCQTLGYDTAEMSVYKPSNLVTAHERLTGIIKIRSERIAKERLEERLESLKMFAFVDEEHELIVRAAETVDEIVAEGKALVHCVGGYAERHANGQLTIVFVRKASAPDTPYYTVEVSNFGQIVQCRGYKNDREAPKPQSIIEFEDKYQDFLNEQFRKFDEKKKKSKKEKTA